MNGAWEQVFFLATANEMSRIMVQMAQTLPMKGMVASSKVAIIEFLRVPETIRQIDATVMSKINGRGDEK